jgi:predicted DNA-binding transcriptional regulator AlpA
MSERDVVPRFLRLPQVLEHVPFSKSLFLRDVADGLAPSPTKFGPRIVAWREDLIAAYVKWFEAKHNGTVAPDSTWRDLLPPTTTRPAAAGIAERAANSDWQSLGDAAARVIDGVKP